MNTNTSLKIGLATLLILGIIVIGGLSMNHKDKPIVTISKENYTNQTHTIDSLTRVVDSL
jgi:hypothetical protein